MGEFETVFFAAVTLVSRQFFCQYPSCTSVLITYYQSESIYYKASVFNFAKTAQFADSRPFVQCPVNVQVDEACHEL